MDKLRLSMVRPKTKKFPFSGKLLLFFTSFSLITAQLDLEFQPLTTKYGGVIYLNGFQYDKVKPWKQIIDNFLEPYQNHLENGVTCNANHPPTKDKFCVFDLTLGPCISENMYSYHKGSPCIFLSSKKVPNWVPECYNSTSVPEEMPTFLKAYIKNTQNKQMIWVSCNGGTAADVENLGPVEYYPQPGFPVEYFPFSNITGYQSPLVAVHLARPRSGVLINMVCTAWAKNIIRDGKKNLGSVNIDIMID